MSELSPLAKPTTESDSMGTATYIGGPLDGHTVQANPGPTYRHPDGRPARPIRRKRNPHYARQTQSDLTTIVYVYIDPTT